MTTKESIMRITLPVAAILASVGIGFAGITSAQTATSTTTSTNTEIRQRGPMGEKPAVFGKVTAISGTTLTVQSTDRTTSATTDYSVDVSSAKIMKGTEGAAPTESTVSAIVVGDTVAVRGTVSGTSVTATEVMSGVMPHGGPGGFGKRGGHGTGGTVTAVNGTTITLTGKDGRTYTVDASAAQVSKITKITTSDIAVGDTLNVMGEVSGTQVTAKHIMDGVVEKPQQ